MKNISRRVFIKGLAVAGVAAAASTVLAGCNTNMIPGVDDPTEEPSTTSQTLTFADPADKDKTVSITLSDLKIDNTITSGLALKLSAKVVNDAEANIFFVGGTSGAYDNTITTLADKDYEVVISAYPDDAEGNTKIAAMYGLDGLINNATAASITAFSAKATSTVTEEGYLYLSINDEDLEWSKVTVVMNVYKIVKKSTDEVQPVKTLKYTFSK